MIESLVRVIAQQDAHDAGDDGKDTRLGREILVWRLGDGCRVRHEETRDSDHEQLAADFLLDAFGKDDCLPRSRIRIRFSGCCGRSGFLAKCRSWRLRVRRLVMRGGLARDAVRWRQVGGRCRGAVWLVGGIPCGMPGLEGCRLVG